MLNLCIDATYPTVIIICISVNPIEPFLNWLCIITKMFARQAGKRQSDQQRHQGTSDRWAQLTGHFQKRKHSLNAYHRGNAMACFFRA